LPHRGNAEVFAAHARPARKLDQHRAAAACRLSRDTLCWTPHRTDAPSPRARTGSGSDGSTGEHCWAVTRAPSLDVRKRGIFSQLPYDVKRKKWFDLPTVENFGHAKERPFTSPAY